jgi:hypothetical protein
MDIIKMEVIRIKSTEITPTIILDKESGVFVIKGKCLPEDVKSFFTPIIQWFDQYICDPNDETKFVIDFDYFNTASSKMILVILSKLRDIQKAGKQVEVTWKYPQYDIELAEAGEEFSDLLNLPFIFIPKND